MAASVQNEHNAILRSPLFRLESVFSRVTDSLFFASEKAALLKGAMGDLVEITNQHQIDIVSQGRKDINMFATQVDERISQSSGFLREIGRKRQMMNAEIKDLAQNIHSASIVSLNARIIAQGHRTLKQGEQLVRLAENISGITDNASQQVAEMLKATESITKALQKLLVYAEDQSLTLADTIRPEIRSLEKSLQTLSRALENSHEAAEWMNEYYRKAEGDVMMVIQSLQVGDRARQRAEHIQQILHEAASFPTGSHENQLLTALADIQMEQAVQETLTDAEKAMVTLTGLAADLDRYQQNNSALRKAFADRHELNNGVLQTDLLNKQKAEMAGGSNESQALMNQIRESDERLKEHSRNLNNAAFQMQLASLNTIIACAREGRAAADMIVISQQVNSVVSTVPEIYVTFSAALDSTKQHLEDYLAGVTSSSSGNINAEVIAMIPVVVTVVSDLMPKLASDSEQVARAIEASDRMLRELVNDLKQTNRKGTSVKRRFPTSLELEPRFQRVSARIRKLYTMQAERDLHDGLLANYIEADEAPAPVAKKDEVKFEMFDEAPATKAEAAPSGGNDLSDILF
ncbi:hypothetical protein HJ526_15525 [Donghicola sp. C2-DW-16]|uniref:Methyl-accepting chemotaxis protein n=1 Tax=Donghicola mangrovi TaxID=2729614 RepID=A0ABX2PH81_9RHOB|nr:hypothetical protein [Donghicola mangrovi]NVO28840.1 hypothetical protein [Donghicola mangrovi]